METINQPKLDEVIGADTKADQITTDQPSQTDGDVLVETAEIEAVVENPKLDKKSSITDQLKARKQAREQQQSAIIQNQPDQASKEIADSVERILSENIARLNRATEILSRLQNESIELGTLRVDLQKEAKEQVVPRLKKEAENDLKKATEEFDRLVKISATQGVKANKALKTIAQLGRDVTNLDGVMETSKTWILEQRDMTNGEISHLEERIAIFRDAAQSVEAKFASCGIEQKISDSGSILIQEEKIKSARESLAKDDLMAANDTLEEIKIVLFGPVSRREMKRIGGAIQSLEFLRTKIEWLANRQKNVEVKGFEAQRRSQIKTLMAKAAQEFADGRFRAGVDDLTGGWDESGCDFFTAKIQRIIQEARQDQGKFKGGKSTLRQRGGGTRGRR